MPDIPVVAWKQTSAGGIWTPCPCALPPKTIRQKSKSERMKDFMRIWPLSPSLSNEISSGGISYFADQINLYFLLRQSVRIDRFLARAEECRRYSLPEPTEHANARARAKLIEGIDAWLSKYSRHSSIPRDV